MQPTLRRSAFWAVPAAAAAAFLLLGHAPVPAARAAEPLPAPAADVSPGTAPGTEAGLQTAVFSGGCFWGVQAVFQHVAGVKQAVSGYTGGTVRDPGYEQVSFGNTGHAESVRVTFDPKQVSYGHLLQIFFTVALDPTEVDRQGPDSGTQYRSELFVDGPEQARVAHAYVAQLDAAHSFPKPIATRIDPATTFYPAEAYHQDYLTLHPSNPYIAINDMPKLDALHALFPQDWRAEPALVGKDAATLANR